MTDTIQTVPERGVSRDLKARVEAFEVTPDLVAANLSFGDELMELPDEMMSAMRRIYLDKDFSWPTTVSVTRIGTAPGPDRARAGKDDAWTRISVLGTGFDADRPVTLSLSNASGFGDGTAVITDATADSSGFLGADVVLRAVPRHSAEWKSAEGPLTLTASQTDADGRVVHSAEFAGLPQHVLWQWVR